VAGNRGPTRPRWPGASAKSRCLIPRRGRLFALTAPPWPPWAPKTATEPGAERGWTQNAAQCTGVCREVPSSFLLRGARWVWWVWGVLPALPLSDASVAWNRSKRSPTIGARVLPPTTATFPRSSEEDSSRVTAALTGRSDESQIRPLCRDLLAPAAMVLFRRARALPPDPRVQAAGGS